MCYSSLVNSARFFRDLSAMRPRLAVLLTRNPTKDFYPERPPGVKDLSSSHMSIPIQSVTVHLSSALTKNTAPFVFKRLRTLPSSVSSKFCVCRSYENDRVCTNNSRSGTPRCALATRPSAISVVATSFFLSAYSAFSVISALNPFFSFLSTFNFQLWTLNLRLTPTYSLSFHILPHSFALSKNSTPFFSSNSGLFAQNTRGWGGGTRSVSPCPLPPDSAGILLYRLQNSTGRGRRSQSTTLSRLRH